MKAPRREKDEIDELRERVKRLESRVMDFSMASLEDFATNLKGNVATVDWKSLETALGGLAENALMPLVEGEAADIKAFGLEIGADMVSAIMRGDLAWRGRLTNQIKLLAEKARLRANKADWTFAEQALGFVFHAALIGVGAAVPKP